MNEHIEQKMSEIATNNESAIEQGQTETESMGIMEHSQFVNEQNALVSECKTPPNVDPQDTDEPRPSQEQEPFQNNNYEDFHNEASETVQNNLNQQNQGVNEENERQNYQAAQIHNQAFDQFNEVEHNDQQEKSEIPVEQPQPAEKLSNIIIEQQHVKQILQKENVTSFAAYQNQIVKEQKPQPLKQQLSPPEVNSSSFEQKSFPQYEEPVLIEQKPIPSQEKPVLIEQKVKEPTKKKSKKKKQQESAPLPVIGAESQEGKKQILSDKKIEENKKVTSNNNNEKPNNNDSNGNENKPEIEQKIVPQEMSSSRVSEIKEVSQVIDASSVSAGLIIFEAQRERIGSTLDQFIKFIAKHEKHTTSQKQLINNVEEEVQKKKQSKTPLSNSLRQFFEDYIGLCKSLYERSYKFTKSDKIMSVNPLINMKEQLKAGVDELIFLRKSTGNEYNRLGDFIAANTVKNVVRLFADYWKAVDTAQLKHKEKKEEFQKKEKQFIKRISKVVKVYTKGKQGVSQEEDLFIEMTKFINQQKDYRTSLIEYGLSLVPLKKAFIKAEEVLHEELQVLFNGYKNQFRSLYSLHPKEFIQIEKLQKEIRQKNTFQKLSDITDGDYVRSVLLTLQKATIQDLTDKEFQKVLNLLHFEEIMGNSVDLLKGTTSKAFELKNKTEQVVDTVSGNLLIFNKETAQMKEKFIIKNISAKIVQQGVVEIDEIIKGLIFNSNRTVRVTFRDNDRAEELICFLNQIHDSIKQNEAANNKR